MQRERASGLARASGFGRRINRRQFLAGTAAYFFAVSIGYGAGARYRLPMMPAVFLLAGLGSTRFFRAQPENANRID